MANWMKTPTSLGGVGALGEPAHVVNLYVGMAQKDGSPVTREMREAIQRQLAERFKAFTVTEARGRWRDKKTKTLFEEPSLIFSVVRLAAGGTCSRIRGQARNAARAVARTANQFAVLVVTTCADGSTDSELVEIA